MAPSTEAEGDSAGFHLASRRLCGESPVCGLGPLPGDGAAAIELLCLAMDLPPGRLREATDEDVAGGEAMTIWARQIWAERLNPIDDVLPLWSSITEFANQTCKETCGGRCWRRRLLKWRWPPCRQTRNLTGSLQERVTCPRAKHRKHLPSWRGYTGCLREGGQPALCGRRTVVYPSTSVTAALVKFRVTT